MGGGIHEYNNFGSFPEALLVMLRVITGENWPDVMLSSVSGQQCEPQPLSNTSTNCGHNFAYIFFPSFYFISNIMVSMFYCCYFGVKFLFVFVVFVIFWWITQNV